MTDARELFNWVLLGITLCFICYAITECVLLCWYYEHLATKYEHMLINRVITFDEYKAKRYTTFKRENPYIDTYICDVNTDDRFDCVTADGKSHSNVTIVSTVSGLGILSMEGYLYLMHEIVLRKKHG